MNSKTKREPGQYDLNILGALSDRSKHVYAGTVPAAVVAKRRTRGKVARASRKANRGGKR